MSFRGPRRPSYTVEQFAEAYDTTPEMVVQWIVSGPLQAEGPTRTREWQSWRIMERQRLHMLKVFGDPFHADWRWGR